MSVVHVDDTPVPSFAILRSGEAALLSEGVEVDRLEPRLARPLVRLVFSQDSEGGFVAGPVIDWTEEDQ